MPWVEFTADFSWVPAARPMISIAFTRGMVKFVTTECAEKAIRVGKAERAQRPENADDGSR